MIETSCIQFIEPTTKNSLARHFAVPSWPGVAHSQDDIADKDEWFSYKKKEMKEKDNEKENNY